MGGGDSSETAPAMEEGKKLRTSIDDHLTLDFRDKEECNIVLQHVPRH